MNDKQKTIAAIAIVGAATVGAAVQMKSLENQVMARFPEIDPKIARKAYRKMMLKAFTGQYATLPDSDEEMAKIFLDEVYAIKKNK